MSDAEDGKECAGLEDGSDGLRGMNGMRHVEQGVRERLGSDVFVAVGAEAHKYGRIVWRDRFEKIFVCDRFLAIRERVLMLHPKLQMFLSYLGTLEMNFFLLRSGGCFGATSQVGLDSVRDESLDVVEQGLEGDFEDVKRLFHRVRPVELRYNGDIALRSNEMHSEDGLICLMVNMSVGSVAREGGPRTSRNPQVRVCYGRANAGDDGKEKASKG